VNAIGKVECPSCRGDGGAFGVIDWQRCKACDGLGQAWAPGGPRFGARLTLGEVAAGQIVELATGHRARVLWHMPRKNPTTTFVGLIDAFDDSEAPNPTAVHSTIGVTSSKVRTQSDNDRDVHDGEKDADAVDPMAKRTRARAAGPLL
jgi:hypothetical protein